MGDTNIIITPQMGAIFTGLITVALAILSAFARAFLKRMDQSAERFEKLEALIKQSDERSEKRIKESEERSEKRIKQSEERSEKRSEQLEALIKQSEERTGKRIDESEERTGKRIDESEERTRKRIDESEERSEKRSEKLEALIKQSEERSEKRSENQEADNQQRHSETQTELRDLNSRVGRLETPGVHDRSAGRSESQSPRRDHDSATAPEGESDPPPVAKHFDPSMVPPAGGRSETQHSAGLARQAVPDEQQVGETDSEPSEEASPDASR